MLDAGDVYFLPCPDSGCWPLPPIVVSLFVHVRSEQLHSEVHSKEEPEVMLE